ncbi:MAG: translation initiation factor IF-2 [Candidatus Ratteibacteria bacterium]|nr:translation initiation factor IF-2 [Candidatus Ratteibacteria bacterium]
MKKPVYELAKELGLPAKKLLEEIKGLGISAKSHMSSLSEEEYELVKNLFLEQKKPPSFSAVAPISEKLVLKISEGITVAKFAEKIGSSPTDLIQRLIKIGIMAGLNQSLGRSEIEAIAKNLNFNIEVVEREPASESKGKIISEKEVKGKKIRRPPVVVVLGHVDHGKTTLLDTISKKRIAEKEKGQITQHIGASTVELKDGNKIIFLDTPGHEAFTSLRARGSQITDIAVLVVAADDGVQPQTKEAIEHAKAAGIPIIVAINKIDKKNVNPEKVKIQLQSSGLVPEEMGGTTQFINVSALQNTGIDKLLEAILLEYEMLERFTTIEGPAKGYVIETRMDKGRGPLGTLLIQSGILKIGNCFVSGNTLGRVRMIIDDHGRNLTEASPSSVIEVSGFSSVPVAGDDFQVVKNEKEAREIVSKKTNQQQNAKTKEKAVFTLEGLQEQMNKQKTIELRCIMKSDVQGSHEALKKVLDRLSTEEVKINIISQGVGGITNSDVLLAEASNAIIIGFNIGVQGSVQRMATEKGVEIRLYDIIYDAVDDIKKAMEGMLGPKMEEVLIGKAEIKQIFRNSKGKVVAGAQVTEGKVIVKGARIRVLRNKEELYKGRLDSLRRFKDNVAEVKQGYECGLSIPDFQDFQPGDIVEVYTLQKK